MRGALVQESLDGFRIRIETPCARVLVARFGTWRGSAVQCRARSLAAPKINLSAALFELGKYCRRVLRRLSVLSLLSDSEKRCLLPKFATDEVEDAAREYLEQVARSE